MITVVLPAYNEEAALPPLLDALAAVRADVLPDLRVYVVDDGSSDRTADVVREKQDAHPFVRLLQHERNGGLSEAIQTGFRAALLDSAPDDVVVTLDADNTQPPELIPQMVERIAAGGLGVVVASRFQRGAAVHGVPALRRLYSRAMSLLFRTAFPIRGVRDYSSGFRAYRAGTLQQAFDTYGKDGFITEQGFACMVEILFQLDNLPGTRFGEVPMVLRYDLKPTETKMRVFKTIWDTLRVAVRQRAGRGT